MADTKKSQKHRSVTRGKWGIIFLLPFALAFFAFQLYPLVSTIYNSFFKNFRDGLTQVGPEFIGLENFKTLFQDGLLLKYAGNTLIMWLIGFIPQILISLLLASWFANHRLRIRAAGFFKTVIYMPNLIMASAFAMLFFALFSDIGPVNAVLESMGFGTFRFFSSVWATRILVGFMNFLMWFGNTTILLMAGIMGIDPALFEAAEVDGARPGQIFRQITLPILRPILLYVMLTSMIGGIQMFDVPQILTDGYGSPNTTSMTLIMYLNQHMYSKNYGMGGALSVILLIMTAILSLLVFKFMVKKKED
ncbi:MAG: sugar ABC transporter permease [Lachnospiraceae bacterium]|nr:sugar ABC transporter permease [Lachnospiraceae bacterium]